MVKENVAYQRAAISNPLTKRFKQFLYSAAILLAVPQAAEAATLVNSWKPIFEGIDYATGMADSSEPRIQKVNALRIDLSNPDIEFFSTPSNGDAELETFAQTTSDFLASSDVQVAANANFFDPCCEAEPEPKDLLSFAASEGEIVSPPGEPILPEDIVAGDDLTSSLLVSQDNEAEIVKRTNLTGDFSNVFTAVSGDPRLLTDGEIVVDSVFTNDFAGPNPRTAVGLSEDGQELILITIDGRQPGVSEGATLYETAEWVTRFGSYQGLNLDGGGSTTLVREGEFGNPQLLNSPSGEQRFVGNNLGIFADPLPGETTRIPEPSSALGVFVFGAFGAALRLKRRPNKQ